DKFRQLPSSKAKGAANIGRLTNLMQLTVDTSWWTRYRSSTKNPDFGDTFPNAVPSIGVGQHTAIPRDDDDVQPDASKPDKISDFTQAIANTAGFHFAFIEQGGNQPLSAACTTGSQCGSAAHSAKHRRSVDLPLQNLAEKGGQRTAAG